MGGIDNILVTILNIPNALYTANIDNKGRWNEDGNEDKVGVDPVHGWRRVAMD